MEFFRWGQSQMDPDHRFYDSHLSSNGNTTVRCTRETVCSPGQVAALLKVLRAPTSSATTSVTVSAAVVVCPASSCHSTTHQITRHPIRIQMVPDRAPQLKASQPGKHVTSFRESSLGHLRLALPLAQLPQKPMTNLICIL